MNGPFRLSISFYFQDEHPRDWDNCVKGVLDGGVGVLWGNDTWQHFRKPGKTDQAFDLDRENPRVEIEVEAVG